MGFPIRKSADQRVLAPPRGFSQRATSFIASQCQGIHQMPLIRLISIGAHPRRHGQTTGKRHSCAMRRRSPQRVASARRCIRRRCIPMTRPTASSLRGDGPVGSSLGHLFSSQCQRARTRFVCGYLLLTQPILIGRVTRHQGLTAPPGGGERDRTDDLLLAKQVLSQLSYAPTWNDQANSGGPGKI